MMPGTRGMNQRQVKQAMKKMGIQTEELKDVVEVIIRTKFSLKPVVIGRFSNQANLLRQANKLFEAFALAIDQVHVFDRID